ncbi:MAG: hypothetical protein A2W93_00500 [Bacteroidetes bacterium GWF2_43_63]|nr:MAG: hypothetical protein A2W94_13020 [Bacteroidetes bacterium GWE2_42_42]OFY53882.1 MAG: hypothetical protein A2W93_00500 [Bacteroidetes bacterium GWF2_43_63]HBG69844.1 amidohydrolase [Bacteroidales bacterium]HCB60959.1 amidohydrolase [Bacteroidales bacterium]HCY24515.1 amidohydrolase [Bacteroidales bacterium]
MNFIEIRRNLHKHPELSGQEQYAAALIIDKLREMNIKTIHHPIGGQSVLAVIEGKQAGPALLFRCDIDALPIQELAQHDHVSENDGVMHACGHDGHTAIMLRFAEMLMQSPLEKGNVLLLFQAAEETGNGARSIIKSKILDKYNVSEAFALHNIPGFKKNQIICRKGPFTAAVESLQILLIGKTSHASEPEKGISPASAVADIIRYFETLNQTEKSRPDYFMSTPIQIKMGADAFGTSAGEATIGYTFRSWYNTLFGQKKEEIEKGVKNVVRKTEGLDVKFDWVEPFSSCENNADAVLRVKMASEKCNLNYIEKPEPFSWGEDFGLITNEYPGAFFGLGAGTNVPALHNPDYDFPDELIEIGAQMFFAIVEESMRHEA